ncbi:MAG: hypothetical protein QM598_07725 [Protaetiibacter sp.]
MLSTAARAYARCWPALLAWFLAGWTARLLLLRFAASVGNELPLVGQLILPLAVIARLASYVAMFLVLRAALPNVADADPPRADGTRMGFLARWGAAISAAILPFFVVYAAWGMISEDGKDYAAAALDQADLWGGGSSNALDVVVDVWSLGIVVLAFAGRWLLQRFSSRLPRWTAVVSAYLEAVWVLVALLVIRELLAGVPAWFATRRMFAPVVDAVAMWREDLGWFRWLGDAFTWLMTQLGDVVFQPLAWVALAAVVYVGARSRASAAAPNARVARARAAVTARWARLPRWVRTAITTVTGGFQERWLPIAGAVRLIWAAGPLTLGGFLLAYALAHAAGEWLFVAVIRVLGPHEFLFWTAVDDPANLLVVALVVPVQLALVAATYDTALGRSTATAPAGESITTAEGGTPAAADRT